MRLVFPQLLLLVGYWSFLPVLFCLHLSSFRIIEVVDLLSLPGYLAIVYDLGPPPKDMDSSGKVFFDSCAPVYIGASMEFFISNFFCGVMDFTEFSILSYKIVHAFFLCVYGNV